MGDTRGKVRAVSLLEVVLATMLFTIVLVLSLGFWSTCSAMIARSRSRLMGTYVAQQMVERAQKAGFEDVDDMAGSGSFDIEAKLRGRRANYRIGYTVTVVDVDDDLKSVQVEVKWSESGGIRIETFVSRFL